MQNRRKFLERSVLGAGSVLFLPVLVGSCNDHLLGPDTPIFLPPLDDYPADSSWNDKAKIVVIAGLEATPEVGEILGPLVDILWPSTQEDVWGQIRAQTEALIDQKIAADKYQNVSDALGGLKDNITVYQHELKIYNDSVTAYNLDPTKPKPNPTGVREQWVVTRGLFVNTRRNFQQSTYELLLLPLFGQYANLYLTLLREVVIRGKDWGREAGEQQQDYQDLKDNIKDFSDYAAKWYIIGLTNVSNATKDDNVHHLEPFRSINSYARPMQLTVIDFLETWAYFDVKLYPNGAKVVSSIIYSDPYGTCDDSGRLELPLDPQTQFPTNITVWGHDRIDAVQLTYPAGSGPNGVTTTPRMGDQSGGTTQDPFGGSWNLSLDNPITQVRALYDVYLVNNTERVGPVVTGMQFKFADGTATNVLSNNNLNSVEEKNDTGLFGYTNRALSSIHINGVNKSIGSADCVVFGFQNWTPPKETLRAIGAIYIKSPTERSAADFAKAFPKLAIPANLITEELKAARRVYWAYIKERAEALK